MKNANPAARLLDKRGELLAAIIALLYTVVSLIVLAGSFKVITIIACLIGASLLIISITGSRLKERISVPVAAMIMYVLIVAVSAAWASAGKFFLREYSKLLIAFLVYLFVLLCLKKTEKAARSLITGLSFVSALYAFLSVDMATIKLSSFIINLIPEYNLIDTSFETGTRLTGIFGNGNMLAGILGLGILLTIYLLETAESKPKKAFAAVCISLSAFTFLLAFSMGASGFFALSIILYLVFAGSRRGNVLLHMLFTAVPTFIFVFISFGYFMTEGSALIIPTVCMMLNALICVGLELFIYPKAEVFLNSKQKIVWQLIIALAVIVSAYSVSALLITGSYDLTAGGSFNRALYPKAGEYTLNISYTGTLNIDVISQNDYDVMKHTSSSIYNGPADTVRFTVPEDSRVIYIGFSSSEGAHIEKATLSDGTSVKLKYRLLPDFIANRLQGLRANENMIQRTVFFNDGMKLFKESPVLGNGMGSFESLICGYQDFYYETKYVHNHYIQVLLDNGILGFISYAAVLLGSLMLLIKGRKKEGEFKLLWPALFTGFIMIIFHSLMEVVMSTSVYLPFAYAIFALIALCYGGDRPDKVKLISGQLSRWCSLALMTVYSILIALNIYANNLIMSNTNNLNNFYKSLSTALSIDCFEYQDASLSAVINYPAYKSPLYKGLVDKCAARLIDTPSNSIHLGLIEYYMKMGLYAKAIEAAEKGVKYNYSNPQLWNNYFSVFYSYTIKSEGENPFLGADGLDLINGIKNLYALMQDYNSKLWEPIVPNESAQALIAYVNSF
jgi:tetratricopeptide (TPR) repeat protein